MITDLTPYRKHVDQFDLTEEQKLELVNSVWMIVDSIFDYHTGLTQITPKKRPFDFGKIKQQKTAAEEVIPIQANNYTYLLVFLFFQKRYSHTG